MSEKWIDPSKRQDIVFSCRELTTNETVVLLAISHHMCRGNEAWPSQARLAALTRISLRTVKRVIDALRKRAIITTTRRSRNSTNRYSIAWDTLAAIANRQAAEEAARSATVTPPKDQADPTNPPARSVTVTPHSVTVTPRSVTVTLPEVSRRPQEGEKKGPPKGKVKEVRLPLPPAGSDEGGELDSEVQGDDPLPEDDCSTFTSDLDSGWDEGGELDSDETEDDTPAQTGESPCPTWDARISQLKDIDLDSDDWRDTPDQPDTLPNQTIPQIPAVDPEEAEARLYMERVQQEERQKLADAKQLAAALDLSLAAARDTNLPTEKRVQHAGHVVRGVEKLAALVGHRYRIRIQKSTVPLNSWSDTLFESLQALAQEVTVWDVFIGFEAIADLDQCCWRVAVKDAVWDKVSYRAELAAGDRLLQELGFVSYAEATPIDAVRKYRAGLIDREGNRVARSA